MKKKRPGFGSCYGLNARETPREISLCAHAVFSGEQLVIFNAAADPKFNDNPLVSGELGIRFYAGAPHLSPRGGSLGTFCLIDQTVHSSFTAEQLSLRAHGAPDLDAAVQRASATSGGRANVLADTSDAPNLAVYT